MDIVQAFWARLLGQPPRSWALPTQEGSSTRNAIIFQAFEWDVPADQRHWQRLQAILPDLKELGISAIWLPPGCKACGPQSNGYDIYDLYDLGEFDWKMSRATKWGSKEDLTALAAAAREQGTGLLWDAVLNHKAGADYSESVVAVAVDPRDRRKETGTPEEIDAWVGFNFPARGSRYSTQKYQSAHFSGTDFDARKGKHGIQRFMGKRWARDVDTENGNFDYLMFANLDYSNQEVVKDVCQWGRWIANEIPLQGMRLDAVRHISRGFVQRFMATTRATHGPGFLFVGEYWVNSLHILRSYLSRMGHSLCLFDVPLVYNLAKASKRPDGDLREILSNTLMNSEPEFAVTFVSNHDTQLGQTMSPDATVEATFLPSAYAFVLLRAQGIPCIFYGDLYGTQGKHAKKPVAGLPLLCRVRKRFAYGFQRNYFDQPHCVGWTREGVRSINHGCGLAVLIANGARSTPLKTNLGSSQAEESEVVTKRMCVGVVHVGEIWVCILGGLRDRVVIDQEGMGKFSCFRSKVAVWISQTAEGLDSILDL